jgi:putative transcriptional regulator
MEESLEGQFLVAAPTLTDPNFARTVVLICEHSEEGALGVVLNRPAEVSVGEAAPGLADGTDPDDPLWVGGPVKQDGVLVLVEWRDPPATAQLVVGAVGVLAEGDDVADLPALADRVRGFAGFAGWGPGQLDGEIEAEGWLLAPATADDVFTDDPENLWATVLRRMGGTYALLATMPEDPSVN